MLGQAMALPSVLLPADTIPGALAPRDIASGLRLLGAVLPATPVTAGTTASVTLYVQKTGQAGGAANPAQLTGESLADSEPIPSAQLLAALPVGDVVALRHVLTVSARATVRSVAVNLATAQGSLTLGQLAIAPLPRAFSAPAPQHVLSVRFGQVAELVGYDVATDLPVNRLTTTLYWKALQPSDVSYTVFTHLVGPNNAIQGQHDGLPAGGRWPTTSWLANQIITDSQQLSLSASTTLPQDTLQVGLYASQAPGQPRLPASGPPGEAGDTYAVLAVGR